MIDSFTINSASYNIILRKGIYNLVSKFNIFLMHHLIIYVND